MSGESSRRIRRELIVLAVVLIVCALIYRFQQKPEPTAPVEPATTASPVKREVEHSPVESDIQMALILDTSASMDGLIRQAREQILEIIADLRLNEGGKPKTIAVALYRYGSDQASAGDGYTECLVPLTTDYQSIVGALGWLQAGGREEYAPLAISKAVSELSWNDDPTVPKVIVIVGNETFSAGPMGTQEAFEQARSRNIKVLPIYCVGAQASKSALSGWQRAAFLGGTELEMIDPDQVVQALEQPAGNLQPVQIKVPEPQTPRQPRHPHPNPIPEQKHVPRPVMQEAAAAPSSKADFSTGVRRGLRGVLKSY